MIIKEFKLNNSTSLHARPAVKFIKKASKFNSEIFIEHKNKSVDAKSLIGILSLGIHYGSTIKISISGEDEVDALKSLTEFFNEI